MTTYKRRKEKLIDELKDKEYRDAFVAEQINVGIPFQIKTIRNQRKWTQKKLGENVPEIMKQEQISRLEDPNYSQFSLTTLKRLASAFEVGLVVRFVPISELVEWELRLTSESLEAVSFDQDSYFEVKPEETSSVERVPIRLSDATEDCIKDLSRTTAATNVVIVPNRAIAENQALNTSRLSQCSA